MIPPRAVIVENADWVIGTWSAQKVYTFEAGLAKSKYLTWAKRAKFSIPVNIGVYASILAAEN
jgi:hypothetical protein